MGGGAGGGDDDSSDENDDELAIEQKRAMIKAMKDMKKEKKGK